MTLGAGHCIVDRKMIKEIRVQKIEAAREDRDWTAGCSGYMLCICR